ncbi:unnamed protein product [Schistosoma curassoni]|nr:unnamed protein product [Schistosoma curassoni]
MMYHMYITFSIQYVHWHKDNDHNLDIESNMDLDDLLKEKYGGNLKGTHSYNPYEQKLSSKSLSGKIIDKLQKDTKNYEKEKSIIDQKMKPNQNHHYGTSIIITHNKYTSIINGKKKTDEDETIEAEEYDDHDDVHDVVDQDLKVDKHSYSLLEFPFTVLKNFGFGGWF